MQIMYVLVYIKLDFLLTVSLTQKVFQEIDLTLT